MVRLSAGSSAHKFWAKLREINAVVKDEDGILSYLPLDVHYGASNVVVPLTVEGNPTNQLIIRACFGPLFDELWAKLSNPHFTVTYVTGTPGVGTTTFRNYVAWRIVQLFAGKPVAIAMAKADDLEWHHF